MDQLKLSKENFKNSKDFILTNARMIERRWFHHEFENDSKSAYATISLADDPELNQDM